MFGLSRRKAATSGRGGGFLSRLARDSRGNTLAIVGAALIPLAAMIGSGVDMSRAYMAKTRLQTACDAAALAGRRVMQNDTLNQTVTDEATRFFNYNFNQGQYGTATFTYVATNPGNVPLSGVAVRDDDGTPADAADDFAPTLAGGDTNGDGYADILTGTGQCGGPRVVLFDGLTLRPLAAGNEPSIPAGHSPNGPAGPRQSPEGLAF